MQTYFNQPLNDDQNLNPALPAEGSLPQQIEPTAQNLQTMPQAPLDNQQGLNPAPQEKPMDYAKLYDYLKQNGFSDKEIVAEFKTYGLDDNYLNSLTNKPFELLNKDDDVYKAIIQDIAQGKSIDNIRNDVSQILGEEEADKLVKQFQVSRIFNNKDSGDSIWGYKKLLIKRQFKEIFPEKSKEDIDKLVKQYQDYKGMTIGEELDRQITSITREAKQFGYGVLDLLSNFGIGDKQEIQSKIAELNKEEEITQAERDSLIDIGDIINPANLLTFMATGGSGVLLKAVGAGASGAVSYLHSRGQGDSQSDALMSGAIGASIPITFDALKAAFPIVTRLFYLPKAQIHKDIQNNLGEMSVKELSDVVNYMQDNKYLINIGALTKEKSETYRIGIFANTFNKIAKDSAQIDKELSNNAVALQKTFSDMLKSITDKETAAEILTKTADEKILTDPIQKAFQDVTRHTMAKANKEVNQAYNAVREASAEIPPLSPEQFESVLMPFKNKSVQNGVAKNLYQVKDAQNFDVNMSPELKSLLDMIDDRVKDKIVSQDTSLATLIDTSRDIRGQFLPEQLKHIKNQANLVYSQIDKNVKNFLENNYADVAAKYNLATETHKKMQTLLKEGLPKVLKDPESANILDKALNKMSDIDWVNTHNRFLEANMEQSFDLVKKRFLQQKIFPLIDPATSEADYAKSVTWIKDYLQNNQLKEVFGEEISKDLRRAYNISKIVKQDEKLAKTFSLEGSYNSSLLTKVLHHPFDSLRGLTLTKSSSGEKVSKIVNEMVNDMEKSAKQAQKGLIKELLKNPQTRSLAQKMTKLSAIRFTEDLLASPPSN